MITMTLALSNEMNQASLVMLDTHKVGVLRGPAGSQATYGDDHVQVLLWTGTSYRDLLLRSQKMLNRQIARGDYIKKLARATFKEHPGVTIEDVCYALQETRDWFRRVGTGDPTGEDVGDPLVIDGAVIRGSRVHVDTGSTYIQGVRLGERVVAPAPNGPWQPKRSPKAIAKGIIKVSLPVGRYCQYRLAPDQPIYVDADATRHARMAGIHADLDALRLLL